MAENECKRCAELERQLRECEALLEQRNTQLAALRGILRIREALTPAAPALEKAAGLTAGGRDAKTEAALSLLRGDPPVGASEVPNQAELPKDAADSVRLVKEFEEARSASDVRTPDDAAPAGFCPSRFLAAVVEGERRGKDLCGLVARLSDCAEPERLGILQRMSAVHLLMTHEMAGRMEPSSLTWEKRLFMRYGMVDESLMAGRMDVWEALYQDRSEPGGGGIYYLDEWLDAVALGRIQASRQDDTLGTNGRGGQEQGRKETLAYEALSTGQMRGMCVGAGGNAVSILAAPSCNPGADNPVVSRAWLRPALEWVKQHDARLFGLPEGRQVQPLFILFPGYGNSGACWDPYAPYDKETGGPRICLCCFPSIPSMQALLRGLGDYRWELAKAEGRQRWATEGLTGNWLRLFKAGESVKDPKGLFVTSYVHWILKESQRISALETRFREFMWRQVPFSDETRKQVMNSPVFSDLIEKDALMRSRQGRANGDSRRFGADGDTKRLDPNTDSGRFRSGK